MNARACLGALALTLAACSEPREAIVDCAPVGEARPVCGFKNPEDLALLPGGTTLVISQMGHGNMDDTAGSLVFFDLASDAITPAYPLESASDPTPAAGWGEAACPGPPGKALAPHGISLAKRPDGALALYVVNHGREAIELFEVTESEGAPALEWRGCVPAPAATFLNDVAALPDGGLVATHMFTPGGSTFWPIAKAMVGLPTGHVLEWHAGAGFTVVPGSEGALPNGIEASPDGESLYIDMYLGDEVRKLARKSGEVLATVEIASPDNVAWSPDGTLLVASHNAPIREVLACGELERGSCPFHYSIVALDPDTLEPKALYENAGPPMGAGTAALKIGDELVIGTFAGDRIVRVKLPN